jgi:hypothetical protein
MVKQLQSILDSQLETAKRLSESAVVLTDKQKLSLYKKSQNSGISVDILEEVYRRGYVTFNEQSFAGTQEQFAFDRVNSFIAGGFAMELDEDLKKACWKGYEAIGTKKKNGKTVPNCVPEENTPSDREVGTSTLTDIYKNETPGQSLTLKTIKKVVKEATYQGKKVPLNKPMKGDVKKSKVFVDPDGDGKAQKVNFGDKNMTIKKNIPARRKSFRARHNCDNPGPKNKARYWSCRAW